MSNDIRHEKHQDGPKAETRFVQFSPDSIELIADSAGYPNLSKLVTQSLAEDASYRIRELVQVTYEEAYITVNYCYYCIQHYCFRPVLKY